MKGGFFLANDATAFSGIVTTMARFGEMTISGIEGKRFAQVSTHNGQVFTIEEFVPEELQHEFRDEPFEPQADVVMPDMKQVHGFPFECRWENLVSQIAKAASTECRNELWVLDGNGGVWNASLVDPNSIQL